MTTTTTTVPLMAPVEPLTALPDEFEVYVTDEDLALGVPRDSAQCAVTRAVRRYFGLRGLKPRTVMTDHHETYVSCRYYRHDGRYLISRFDMRKPVEPRTVHFTAVR